MKSVSQVFADVSLTEKQMEIARLMLDEHSADEIAEVAHMKVKAVKYHMSEIYKKFKVDNRTQFIVRVLKQVIDLPSLAAA